MEYPFESDEFGTVGGWANSQSDFYAPTPEEAGLQDESEFIDWQEEQEFPAGAYVEAPEEFEPEEDDWLYDDGDWLDAMEARYREM